MFRQGKLLVESFLGLHRRESDGCLGVSEFFGPMARRYLFLREACFINKCTLLSNLMSKCISRKRHVTQASRRFLAGEGCWIFRGIRAIVTLLSRNILCKQSPGAPSVGCIFSTRTYIHQHPWQEREGTGLFEL